jgi:hypothetical protein
MLDKVNQGPAHAATFLCLSCQGGCCQCVLMKPTSIRFFGSHDPEQVVLHLLRAGYAALASGGDDNSNLQSHIRTVYFKHPDAFPEIDAFTLETPSL